MDFDAGLITAYGYEAYRGEERLYWYDDFPHHKHIHPDIKHHRIPAPEISFEQPNLPVLIQEIEVLLKSKNR